MRLHGCWCSGRSRSAAGVVRCGSSRLDLEPASGEDGRTGGRVLCVDMRRATCAAEASDLETAAQSISRDKEETAELARSFSGEPAGMYRKHCRSAAPGGRELDQQGRSGPVQPMTGFDVQPGEVGWRRPLVGQWRLPTLFFPPGQSHATPSQRRR